MTNIEEKAVRLVAERRVLCHGETTDGEPVLTFTVRGDHDVYTVIADSYGVNCDCPSTRRCSHQIAVVLWARHYGVESHLPANVVSIDVPNRREVSDA